MLKVKVLGVSFDAVVMAEALQAITELFTTRRHEHGKMVVTPNPEMLLITAKNKRFRDILNSAFLSIPDGIGILWATTFHEMTKRNKNNFIIMLKAIFSLLTLLVYPRFCRKIIPERITGVDLMERIVDMSRRYNAPIFFLGAAEGVAEKVKEKLERKYPEINIVGTHAGSPAPSDFYAIEKKLKESAPQILLVAFGQEKQEMWIAEHLSKFTYVKIAMGVGGAFDFIAGVRKRAPRWMRNLGIEWLYRLLQEPSRVRRIYNAVLKFPFVIISRRISSSSRVL